MTTCGPIFPFVYMLREIKLTDISPCEQATQSTYEKSYYEECVYAFLDSNPNNIFV
jgi:hypothetical protein